jgi:hypothetical protein
MKDNHGSDHRLFTDAQEDEMVFVFSPKRDEQAALGRRLRQPGWTAPMARFHAPGPLPSHPRDLGLRVVHDCHLDLRLR